MENLTSTSSSNYVSLKLICCLAWMLISQKGICFAQETNPVPRNLGLSHIEINQEFIDFRKLQDVAYRNTLSFGEVLLQSFDSVVSFQNYPLDMDLPHYLNHLTFHFSAIDWTAPHKIEYSYYLEGLEKDWGVPSNLVKAEFIDLPSGHYTFKLKAKIESQIWTVPFEYSFSIQTPWWKTNLAYMVYTFSIIGILVLLAQYLLERNQERSELFQLKEWYKHNNELRIPTKKDIANESQFLLMVHRVLEEHLSDENFGIAELCESLEISRTQLYRKLKSLTGQSTSHYIRSLRLNNAKKMLKETDLSVSEVAYKVGFSSHAYFSRVFKEEFGCAPSEIK